MTARFWDRGREQTPEARFCCHVTVKAGLTEWASHKQTEPVSPCYTQTAKERRAKCQLFAFLVPQTDAATRSCSRQPSPEEGRKARQGASHLIRTEMGNWLTSASQDDAVAGGTHRVAAPRRPPVLLCPGKITGHSAKTQSSCGEASLEWPM